MNYTVYYLLSNMNNNLKKIRMGEYFMNMRQFANMIGVAEQQYQRYESGKSIPSLEIAMRISDRLNKKVEDIWFFNK